MTEFDLAVARTIEAIAPYHADGSFRPWSTSLGKVALLCTFAGQACVKRELSREDLGTFIFGIETIAAENVEKAERWVQQICDAMDAINENEQWKAGGETP